MSKSSAYQEAAGEQQIYTQPVVVIHPGSLFLRVGLASDFNPLTVLHAVARKRKAGGPKHVDSFFPHQDVKSKQLLQEMEDARLQVSHTLQSCLQSGGERRYATPPQQIAAFNRRSCPEAVQGTEATDWGVPATDVVVGDDILYLNPALDFNVHFPFRRGQLNIHGGPGGSLTAVLADLETIWTHILNEKLKIPISNLKYHNAVLIIPDIYNRHHLKELTTLLLSKIGFGGCFLVQDHVAATFGAGLGFACVVDVGDQKTSVSCVEDGISHPSTRVRMEYGGADITQTFHWLLQKCAFPYKSCSLGDRLDALLLHRLKEDFCHVNLNICGSQEKQFTVKRPKSLEQRFTLQSVNEWVMMRMNLTNTRMEERKPGSLLLSRKAHQGDHRLNVPSEGRDNSNNRISTQIHVVERFISKVGDECIVAPLSLFQTELFGISGKKVLYIQERSSGDPEDPHDDNYLRETSRRAVKESLEASFSLTPNDMEVSAMDGGSTSLAEDDIVVDAIDSAPNNMKDVESKDFVVGPGQVLGLDQAILQSIDRCSTEDLKRKMYGCILVVGGGMKFTGIGTWLKNRISLQTPYLFRPEQLEIVTKPKDTDPQHTSWRGAAIMSCLESSQELWIRPLEWEKAGVKILRERAPFIW